MSCEEELSLWEFRKISLLVSASYFILLKMIAEGLLQEIQRLHLGNNCICTGDHSTVIILWHQSGTFKRVRKKRIIFSVAQESHQEECKGLRSEMLAAQSPTQNTENN
jgi:hypothetical protein